MGPKSEMVQSAVSYGSGCALALLSWVCDGTDLWQALAIMLGCLVVAVRLVHDCLKLYREFSQKAK